jgi:hypothetical protein
MFYNNATINEILELEKEQDLFSLLIKENREKRKPYWSDIWDGFMIFKNKSNHSFSFKFFVAEKQLKELEILGWDFNYLDANENNFLNYAYDVKSQTRYSNDNKTPNFMDDSLTYLIENTKDITQINKCNRNILFSMMSFHTAGFDGKEYFKMIKEYPNIDLNLVDITGRNLMFKALMGPAPFPVIHDLVNKNIQLNLVDKDGYNLLHMFCFYGKSKDSVILFNKIFESIDNISIKNKYGEAFLDSFITGSIDNSINDEHKKRYKGWLDISLNKIKNGEFKKSQECYDGLLNILTEHKAKYQSIENDVDYEQAIKALNYMKLNDILEVNNTNKRKFKV